MMLWMLISALAAAAGLGLVWPLLRPRPAAADPALLAARARLAELEADLAAGRMDAGTHEALRAEAARCLLALDAAPAATSRPAPALAAILALLAIAGALGLYGALGSRGWDDPARMADPAGEPAHEDMAALVQKLADKLKDDPGNVEGWALLARSWYRMERWDDAVFAYRTALAAAGPDADLTGELVESLVRQAGGEVTDEALALIDQVRGQDPGDPRARYFSALAQGQRGDPAAMLQGWAGLLADAPPGSDYAEPVAASIREAALRAGLDPADYLPAALAPGPTPDQMAAAADMAPADRQAMIESMVARLAARLEQTPDDAEGWQRLARAYRVLGQTSKAEAAEARLAALGAGVSGPTPGQMEDPAALAPADRQAMIAGMVEELAEKQKSDPDNLQGWLMLGRSQAVLGRMEDAASSFGQAARLAPDNKDVLAAAAAAKIETVSPDAPIPEEALALLRRVQAIDPDHPAALWHLGRAAARAGDTDLARALWGRLLKQLPAGDPDQAMVKDALDGLKG